MWVFDLIDHYTAEACVGARAHRQRQPVLEGAVHVVAADDTEEVTRAGEAYYWPAGHTARMDEATAFLEIGPVKEMRQFSEHAKAKFS